MVDLLGRLREEAAQQRAWQRRHRVRRRAAAAFRGYFWMPCPLCSEEFGGHEWIGRIQMPTGEPGMTQGVCPACELDLGIQAFQMCERDGHQPIQILAGGGTTSSSGGTFDIVLSVDLSRPPIRAYCQACGLDLPIDT